MRMVENIALYVIYTMRYAHLSNASAATQN